jgi:hypothetical protein
MASCVSFAIGGMGFKRPTQGPFTQEPPTLGPPETILAGEQVQSWGFIQDITLEHEEIYAMSHRSGEASNMSVLNTAIQWHLKQLEIDFMHDLRGL